MRVLRVAVHAFEGRMSAVQREIPSRQALPRPRILFADDHRIVAEGIGRLLERDFEIVETIDDGDTLLDAARRTSVDAIVSDITMPGRTGLAVLKQLRAEGSDVRFIFLTMHTEPALVASAMRAGANGYVLKGAAGQELATAMFEVLAGGSYVTPSVAAQCLDHSARQVRELSAKQREVLQLIANGLRPKQIAAKLGLSVRTVEAHKYAVMQILFVHSTLALVRRAKELGLLFD
jgi:DNA-binding NarL/FixJ family response regulator